MFADVKTTRINCKKKKKNSCLTHCVWHAINPIENIFSDREHLILMHGLNFHEETILVIFIFNFSLSIKIGLKFQILRKCQKRLAKAKTWKK